MFIFGGDDSGDAGAHGWCLDLSTWQWEEVPRGDHGPPRLEDATIECHDGKAYVFGGTVSGRLTPTATLNLTPNRNPNP